ncbi:putative purine permease 5 [Asimina triloba]
MQYALAFFWVILGSALHGLIFALSELVFLKLLGRRSFDVVLEQQVMDFQAMKTEARGFKEKLLTTWLGVLGGTAMLYLTSTVLAGILNTVRIPLTSIAAVILFHDPMSGFKILSLILTVWGFGSLEVKPPSGRQLQHYYSLSFLSFWCSLSSGIVGYSSPEI